MYLIACKEINSMSTTNISVRPRTYKFLKRFYLFIYSFIYLEGEGGRKGEKRPCVVASCVPHHQGPSRQPRHVPWPGTQPATRWFRGQRSIHWATPVRVRTHTFLTKNIGENLYDFGLDKDFLDAKLKIQYWQKLINQTSKLRISVPKKHGYGNKKRRYNITDHICKLHIC